MLVLYNWNENNWAICNRNISKTLWVIWFVYPLNKILFYSIHVSWNSRVICKVAIIDFCCCKCRTVDILKRYIKLGFRCNRRINTGEYHILIYCYTCCKISNVILAVYPIGRAITCSWWHRRWSFINCTRLNRLSIYLFTTKRWFRVACRVDKLYTVCFWTWNCCLIVENISICVWSVKAVILFLLSCATCRSSGCPRICDIIRSYREIFIVINIVWIAFIYVNICEIYCCVLFILCFRKSIASVLICWLIGCKRNVESIHFLNFADTCTDIKLIIVVKINASCNSRIIKV